MDLGQVDANHAVKGSANIEGRGIYLFPVDPRLGQQTHVDGRFDRQRCNRGFQFAITFHHLRLVKVVEVQRLGQGEDMFIAIIAYQRGPDRLC